MITKQSAVIFVIIFALVAYLIDSHVPVITFKMPLSEHISIKISVYDNDTGFTKQFIANIKAMIDCWKGF